VIRRSSVSARDIWLIDVDHPVPARFTFGPSQVDFLAWSPDGRRIAFESDRFGPWDLFVKSVDGGGAETPVLVGGSAFKQPTSWTADGKSIVFEQSDPKTGWDIVYVAADGKSPAVTYLNAPYSERQAYVSPDGRWVAYGSDESGKFELFVQSFPVPGAKYQLTSKGINTFNERWTKNGKEFMFLSGDANTVMAIDVTTGGTFRAGAPRALFKLRADVVGYDFTPDGERVLVSVPAGTSVPPSITIDVNWASQLAK
jgi:Tol biopolymer transport system component